MLYYLFHLCMNLYRAGLDASADASCGSSCTASSGMRCNLGDCVSVTFRNLQAGSFRTYHHSTIFFRHQVVAICRQTHFACIMLLVPYDRWGGLGPLSLSPLLRIICEGLGKEKIVDEREYLSEIHDLVFREDNRAAIQQNRGRIFLTIQRMILLFEID